MVVEDHTEARAAMLLLLEAEGYDAVGAVDGQEAFDHLRRGRASLILLDLMLPHNNGSEFRAEHLRDSDLGRDPRDRHLGRRHRGGQGGGLERQELSAEAHRCRRVPPPGRPLLPKGVRGGASPEALNAPQTTTATEAAVSQVRARRGGVGGVAGGRPLRDLLWGRPGPDQLQEPHLLAIVEDRWASLRRWS